MVAATELAAVAWYFSPLDFLIDLTVKASALACSWPAAASYGDSMIVTCAGPDQRTGEGFFHIERLSAGRGRGRAPTAKAA